MGKHGASGMLKSNMVYAAVSGRHGVVLTERLTPTMTVTALMWKDRWFVAFEGEAAHRDGTRIYHLYPAWEFDIDYSNILPAWLCVCGPKESVVY